tara:strand:+ start:75 stop:458 length:384 start_codon:yes stop_codon:yes gene_type:complete
MKIFILNILILFGLNFPLPSFASHIELNQCVEIAHCVREEWDVSDIDSSFEDIKQIIENTPRSKIVQFEKDYLHAEVTSKWMRYVDDLELSFFPESNKLTIRSESRVGESDLGVNQKRVDLLKSKLY